MNYIDLIINIVLIPVVMKIWNEIEERKKRKTTLIRKNGEKETIRYTRKEQKKKQEQKSEWASRGFRVSETEEINTWKEQ